MYLCTSRYYFCHTVKSTFYSYHRIVIFIYSCMSLLGSKKSAPSLLKPQYQRVCWYTAYVKSTLLMYLLSLSLLCQINCYVNQPSSLLLSFKAPLLPSHHCIKSLIVSLPFTVYEHHSYYCCRCQAVIIISIFTGCLSSWRYTCHPYSFTVKYLTFRHILFSKRDCQVFYVLSRHSCIHYIIISIIIISQVVIHTRSERSINLQTVSSLCCVFA